MARIKCPKCQQIIALDSSSAVETVACPGCAAKLRVPAALRPPLPAVLPEAIQPGPPALAASAAPLDELEVVDPEERAEPEPAPRFQPAPYRPEGGVSLLGVPVLLGAIFLGGLFFGWLAAFVGQWFYLVILFPLGMGLGLCGAGYLGVQLGKVRSRWLGAFAGLVGGMVTIVTYHYCIYSRALGAVADLPALQRLELQLSPATFFRFVDARAKDGVRLSSTRSYGSNKSESNLGYTGSYIYWFVEFLIVAGIGMAGIFVAASQPFCGRCKSWKEERPLITFETTPGEVTTVLREGNVARLADCHPGSPTAPGSLLLSAAVCPNCESKGTIDIKLEQVMVNNQGNVTKKQLLHLTYPRKALAAFQDLSKGRGSGKGAIG